MERSKALWQIGKNACDELRMLKDVVAEQIADRITEFCIVMHNTVNEREVPEALVRIAQAIGTLESLRFLMKLVGKPGTTRLTVNEIKQLQKQLKRRAKVIVRHYA